MDKSYQLNESHSNRYGWEFGYTAKNLAQAAAKQRTFRNGRVEFWSQKKKEVMEKIKTSGISVHESPGATVNYTTAAGGQVMIDATLQKDLTECHNKIQEHMRMATIYDGWVQVLEANPDLHLQLTHADWLFFFGR